MDNKTLLENIELVNDYVIERRTLEARRILSELIEDLREEIKKKEDMKNGKPNI